MDAHLFFFRFPLRARTPQLDSRFQRASTQHPDSVVGKGGHVLEVVGYSRYSLSFSSQTVLPVALFCLYSLTKTPCLVRHMTVGIF